MKASVVKGVLAALTVVLAVGSLPQKSFGFCNCRKTTHHRVVRRSIVYRRVARPVIVERVVSRPTYVERVIERPAVLEATPVIEERPVYVYKHHKGIIPKMYTTIFGGR